MEKIGYKMENLNKLISYLQKLSLANKFGFKMKLKSFKY